jgi:hypothetical protein
MDNLDEIIKNQMISSYSTNIAFRSQLLNIFNGHKSQNIKYHIMWLFFHSFSFAYPENPSEEYKIETANFISNIIPKNLGGCGGCQNDYKIYIEKFNVFRIVSSKQELATFFVDLHNYINKKKFDQGLTMLNNTNQSNIYINNELMISSPINFNYEDVKNKYEKTDFISLLENKFNINIFKLIENKSLSTFYEIFNKINFNMVNIEYNINFKIV